MEETPQPFQVAGIAVLEDLDGVQHWELPRWLVNAERWSLTVGALLPQVLVHKVM